MDALEQRLQERFGLPSFRPWQREAIGELLTGKGRVLVVAPTGGGKSLCYWFPATELGGTTIVVSPLIALMEDQVRALRERDIPATFLASTVAKDEQRQRLADLRAGNYRLVFVAPERLAFSGTLELIARLAPPLIAIDEAHCISHWGHDFRPDYLRLGEVLESLRPPRVLACTATATPIVRDEILARLGLDPASTAVVLRGFARPNLHLACLELDKRKDQRLAVQEALRVSLGRAGAVRGGAIVYASTRKRAERLGKEIERAGYCAAVYHAGLAAGERHEVSERFASGELEVVAATNAFGMGIDRADIRAVVHAQAPGSIEAYYQEVGRAGRDGHPAAGILLTSAADLGLRRRLIESTAGDKTRVDRQWNLFLDLMRYVEAGSCRHDFILRYFGDEQEILGGCGHCDVCNRLGTTAAGVVPPGVSADDAIVVRKALSGVARARARVGMRGVADMLAGRESDLLKRQGLDRLSTFGVLGDRSPTFALALLRRLVTAGLVDVSTGDYPMPRLTTAGVQVMKDEAPVRVLLPAEPREPGPRPRRSRNGGADDDAPAPAPTTRTAEAFEALRKTRRRLASERGVPAYVVCHDSTLLAIAERLPRSRAELHDVPGMGPKRIDAYGDAFLEAIAEPGERPP